MVRSFKAVKLWGAVPEEERNGYPAEALMESASITEPVPTEEVLDEEGRPVLDENGKPKIIFLIGKAGEQEVNHRNWGFTIFFNPAEADAAINAGQKALTAYLKGKK